MRTNSNTKKCSILNRCTQNLRHESEIMPSLRLKHAGLKQSKLYVEMAKMREPVVNIAVRVWLYGRGYTTLGLGPKRRLLGDLCASSVTNPVV